jgi:formylglycine-generating enzyme required for sulfatase activity
VRDDFWMATARFMRDLEVPLVEGQNSAAADLFDLRHACRVLAAFGRAFGALPEGELTSPQEDFLERAVAGLAQEGKVIPVRLSLFAQMVQGNHWLPATLKEVGGAEGVGVTFLEQAFSGASAPPEHRLHQKAARAILQALLPEQGTDLKGLMRSHQELLEASGYADRPQEFNDLVRMLDSELRLVTPSDPERVASEEQETAPAIKPASTALSSGTAGHQPLATGKYYQLTHDYLVPALREWLTCTQKETWRGRAELRLEEWTGQWSRNPSRRLLPSLPEYLWLVLGVPRAKRKPPERALLSAAGRYHGLNWGLMLCALVVAGVGLQQYVSSLHRATDQERAKTLVNLVANAAPPDVPAAIEQLKPMRRFALPVLRDRFDEAPADSSQRLHIAFTLAAFGEIEEDFLLQRTATIPVSEARNMMTAIAFAKAALAPKLLQRVEREQNPEVRARFAIFLLHLGDPGGAQRVLALAPDPASRTAFIHSFADWHGSLLSLPDLLADSGDPAFQSGICAALGLITPDNLAPDEREALGNVLVRLYREPPDGGVHSAAGWSLRRWNRKLPVLERTQQAPAGRGWFVNHSGMTMLAIRPGTFTMGDPAQPDSAPHQVTLTRPFFLCDTEISSDLFHQFLNDPQYPDEKKPKNWTASKKGILPTGDRSLGMVSWLDALLFCNWLSQAEGRQPCYHSTKQKTWECNFETDGYRLPTEAEWEYACRAGTTTAYAFGNDTKLLPGYAFFNLNSEGDAWPGGMKIPNSWGLFDMHGNVAEWCWDWYGAFAGGIDRDPRGPVTGTLRLCRGGDFFVHPVHLQSGNRLDRSSPTSRVPRIGFRVLCSSIPVP